MKLYEYTQAPNPRRVRIFLAEKDITVPSEQIDLATGQHRSPEFIKKNPMGAVPVLELDDGRYMAESVAICRYFEGLHPDPPLMGTDSTDTAWVEMWNRRMEFELFIPIASAFRHTSSFFKGRIPQIAEYGALCKKSALKRLEWLDSELDGREFVAGDRFTIADITAMVAIDFGRPTDIGIKPAQKNLERWYKAVSSRPSAKA